MTEQRVKISEPVSQRDFEEALGLIESNLLKYDISVDDLKRAAISELLIAKVDSKIVGMLRMWHPGKIFREHDDEYFCFEKIKYPKKDLGYIALVAVDSKYQGQGIGRKLAKKAIEHQKEWGAKAVIVHATKNSPGNASEKLFSSLGFKPTHLHKQPWYSYSKDKGPQNFLCIFCGNPCRCDQLEMVLEIS